MSQTEEDISPSERKKLETRLFLFIAILLFPIIAILLVGGYGFAVWIYQIIAGPPGPPG